MKVHVSKPLFAWECLQDSPSLKTIRLFLESVPDAALLRSLRDARGKGRNDYPVEVLWGTLLLTIALRHPHFENTLAELRRNPPLASLIGIQNEEQVPDAHNLSRFLEKLGQAPHRDHLQDVFDTMVSRLGQAVPDFGKHTAGDATALQARRDKRTKDIDATAETRDAHGLPIATGGRKEYTDDQGHVTQVVEWFGYKVHLLVDVKHEVILAWQMTSPKTTDNEMIEPLVEQAAANLPAGRIETLAYDKAADDGKVHALLHEHGITPVIELRSQWQNQREKLVPGQERRGNIVYTEEGTVLCINTKGRPGEQLDPDHKPVPIRQPMAYAGHEKSRGTLKYRCPARHQGWECPMSSYCNQGKNYGLTVRVKREIDLRRFPPVPRSTKKFEELYKGRTAVERVNARLKLFWGADDGNITGSARFFAFVGTIMVVHAAFATLLAKAPRYEGRLGQTKLSPIAQHLTDLITA